LLRITYSRSDIHSLPMPPRPGGRPACGTKSVKNPQFRAGTSPKLRRIFPRQDRKLGADLRMFRRMIFQLVRVVGTTVWAPATGARVCDPQQYSNFITVSFFMKANANPVTGASNHTNAVSFSATPRHTTLLRVADPRSVERHQQLRPTGENDVEKPQFPGGTHRNAVENFGARVCDPQQYSSFTTVIFL